VNVEEPRSRIFIIVVLGVLVAVFYVTAAAHFSYTTDDSYIYFQYARNLSQGNGPSFNQGEPSYGFTGPLWLLMLSAGGAAGADIPLLGKALDLIFAALSIVLFFFVAYELIRDVAVSFCATLAFSVNAWLLRWAGCGLETSLAVFLLLAFFRYLLRNEYAVSAGVLGLLALVRPEASLLLGLLFIDLGVNSQERGHALRVGTRALSVWLAIVLPWTVYAYATFGTVLPATFGAKHGAVLNRPTWPPPPSTS
jgi:arabinofuranosyltransferase